MNQLIFEQIYFPSDNLAEEFLLANPFETHSS